MKDLLTKEIISSLEGVEHLNDNIFRIDDGFLLFLETKNLVVVLTNTPPYQEIVNNLEELKKRLAHV